MVLDGLGGGGGGTNNPPGSEIVPTAGSLSYGPLSVIDIVTLLPLIVIGTDIHEPLTNFKYCEPAGTALGNVIVIVIDDDGAKLTTDQEKKL